MTQPATGLASAHDSTLIILDMQTRTAATLRPCDFASVSQTVVQTLRAAEILAVPPRRLVFWSVGSHISQQTIHCNLVGIYFGCFPTQTLDQMIGKNTILKRFTLTRVGIRWARNDSNSSSTGEEKRRIN